MHASRDSFDRHANVVNVFLDKRLEFVDQSLKQARQKMHHLNDRVHTNSAPDQSGYLTPSRVAGPAGMMCSLFIKPYHLPILVAMTLLLLAHSDARVSKKPHPIADKVRLLHKRKMHSDRSVEPPSNGEILAFSGRMVRESWRKNVTSVADEFRNEFESINQATHGDLAKTLMGVFELRLLDLQHAVRHARAMVDIMQQLSSPGDPPEVGCLSCDQKNATSPPI
jgi:hypothetical protein